MRFLRVGITAGVQLDLVQATGANPIGEDDLALRIYALAAAGGGRTLDDPSTLLVGALGLGVELTVPSGFVLTFDARNLFHDAADDALDPHVGVAAGWRFGGH